MCSSCTADLSQYAATYFELLPDALRSLIHKSIMEGDESSFKKLTVACGLTDFTHLCALLDSAVNQGLDAVEQVLMSEGPRYNLSHFENVRGFQDSYIRMRSDLERSLTELELILLLEYMRMRETPISGNFSALRSDHQLRRASDWGLDKRPQVLMNSCPFMAANLLLQTNQLQCGFKGFSDSKANSLIQFIQSTYGTSLKPFNSMDILSGLAKLSDCQFSNKSISFQNLAGHKAPLVDIAESVEVIREFVIHHQETLNLSMPSGWESANPK